LPKKQKRNLPKKPRKPLPKKQLKEKRKMADLRLIYGFHAVTARIRQNPESVTEVYLQAQRHDPRMRDLIKLAEANGVRIISVEEARLNGMAGNARHQGVAARVDASRRVQHLADVLDTLTEPPLLLVLDGVQDPHNLGACLRSADAFGVHAVIAPKDRAVGITATVEKVACGAAETVPYITVTNLARTLRELQENNIWVVGAAGEAEQDLHSFKHRGGLAWVLGAEGEGLRRLTRETCDELVRIPMLGSVESLNVSVSAGICLFEARRQRNG
jgi:23S rRNA (guanosine2251-2'-O)-methyltransferase